MQQVSLNVNQCERVNKRHGYLSCIPSVNELHAFLSSKTVDIQFIRVSAPMPFLFGSPLMKLHSLKHTKKHFETCGSVKHYQNDARELTKELSPTYSLVS